MKREFAKWEALRAAQLVKQFEGLSLVSYKCPAGIWTIGYGHTGGVTMGERVSPEQADRMLTEDLENFQRRAVKFVKVPVTCGQFQALLSLAFNLGGLSKCPKLVAALNQGKVKEAADEFLDICTVSKTDSNGKKIRVRVAGLVERRRIEREVFLS